MNNKLFLLLFALVCVPLIVRSQDFNDYVPITASGNLPEDFTKLSSQKYNEEKSKIDKNSKAHERKAQDKFYFESNFKIDNLLLSGKILYNDPICVYVNKVADKLLAHDPGLRKEIRIYVTKSSVLNAFATNSGIIFVNLGLISQLENEAQLAFILAHEISHYNKKHVLNEYIESESIRSGKGAYRRLSTEEKYLMKNNYSKEVESEADQYGYSIYEKSPYSSSAVPSVFNVLHYSYLPFDDLVFDSTYFNTEYLKFPSNYFLNKTADIKANEDYDDSKSTHPNTAKRKAAIKEMINSQDSKSSLFLVSEEEFYKVRKIARFEISRLYLLKRKYEAAIYHTYLLLKEEPNSKFLKKNLAKALYGLSKYSNASEFSEVHDSYDDVEGCSQQVYHFFSKIKSNELNVLALIKLWELKKEYPDDEEVKLMTKDIFNELVLKHYQSRFEFFNKPKEVLVEEKKIDSVKVVLTGTTSKYDKITSKQTISEVVGEENFIKYAFVGLFKDEEFVKEFDYLIAKHKEERKAYESLNAKERHKYNKAKDKERELNERKGYALGLDKVVIVNPFYYRIDERKKNAMRYLATEEGQQKFDDQIKANANALSLPIDMIDENSYTASDVKTFNESTFLHEWISEKMSHDDVKMISPLHNEMKAYSALHGTKNFSWMGMVSTTNKKENQVGILVLTAFTIYALPYGIYYCVTPEHRTYFYTLVYDVDSEELKMITTRKVYGKDTQSIINSQTYYSLLQLKHKRK